MTDTVHAQQPITNIPTTFSERKALVSDAVTSPVMSADALALLIETARDAAKIEVGSKSTGSKLEAPEASTVQSLLAEWEALDSQKKALDASIEPIKEFFRDLIGEHEELTVHHATVITYKASHGRDLNKDYLKKLFPDTPENSDAWVDTSVRRMLRK